MIKTTRRELLKKCAALAISPALLYSDSRVSAGRVCDPYRDAVLIDGEPPIPASGSFTVAVLPDTQYYSAQFPETYHAQTQWLVANKTARNIACVLHLGDLTDHNTPEEWEIAKAAMGRLDGQIPYFLVAGNHDYGESGRCENRTTRLNEYFPVEKYQDLPTFGGCYDQEPTRMENTFHRFSAGGRDFLVLALEFGPRRDVVRWAREVVARHQDHEVILMTHAYLYHNNARYDWKKFGGKQFWSPHCYPFAATGEVMDGERLWAELVSRSENFILTLNGHVLGDGLGKSTTATPGGRAVHELLVNFQMRPGGGDGWLRLLEFQSDSRIVKVYDYSPTRNQRNESSKNEFEIALSAIG
jgi:3',5'-cyclic AMP phosphodiesterase CpdA